MDELGAGKVVDGIIDIYPNEEPAPVVEADVNYVQTLMGIEVPADRMAEILEQLGIKTIVKENQLICESPVWRQDIKVGADTADVVLPQGASLEVNNEIKGFRRGSCPGFQKRL